MIFTYSPGQRLVIYLSVWEPSSNCCSRHRGIQVSDSLLMDWESCRGFIKRYFCAHRRQQRLGEQWIASLTLLDGRGGGILVILRIRNCNSRRSNYSIFEWFMIYISWQLLIIIWPCTLFPVEVTKTCFTCQYQVGT